MGLTAPQVQNQLVNGDLRAFVHKIQFHFKTPVSLHGTLDGLDALDESLLDNEGIYAAKYNDGMKECILYVDVGSVTHSSLSTKPFICKEWLSMNHCIMSFANLDGKVAEVLKRWTPRTQKVKPVRIDSMDLWSDRLGGASPTALRKIAKQAQTIQFNTGCLSLEREMAQKKSNIKKGSHSGQIPRVTTPGYKFWGDASGPHVKSLIYHYQYVFGWLDDATNYLVVHLAKQKSEAKECFLQLLAWSPYVLKVLETDNAKEYLTHDMAELASGKCMHKTSPNYVSQRNARMEHSWYRCFVKARYLMARCKAWRCFWAFAFQYAVVLRNHSVYGPTGKIPYEDYFKLPADYTKFYTFGCTVVIRMRMTDIHGKAMEKGEYGIYLGWDPVEWKQVCYGLDSKRVIYGPENISFYETNFGAMRRFQRRNPKLLERRSELTLAEGEKCDIQPNPTQPKVTVFDDSAKGLRLFLETNTEFASSDRLPDDDNVQTPMDTELTPMEMEDDDESARNLAQPRERMEPRSSRMHSDVNQLQQENIDDSVDEPLGSNRTTRQNGNPRYDERIIPTNNTNQELSRLVDKVPSPPPMSTPTQGTKRYRSEADNLITQNQNMELPSSYGKDTTAFTTTLLMCMLNTPITKTYGKNSLHPEISECHPNSQDLWFNKCEWAMHTFMLNGLEESGYWTELTLRHETQAMKKKKKAYEEKRSPELDQTNAQDYSNVFACPTMDGPEPQTRKQAQERPDGDKYEEATIKELQGHYDNNTWEACELPPGFDSIDTRMVYVRKINPDDTVKYKARMVARGFTQVDGENFNWDTVFAPVLRASSLRWLFSLIAEYKLEVTTSDVTQAFLQADIKEEDGSLQEIYIKLPTGCEQKCPHTGKILKYGRLNKALYGLKQAPKRWNKTLSDSLLKLGFIQHESDPCLYTKTEKGSILIYGIYVDDIIKVTNNKALRQRIDKQMTKEFKIEHQGELKEFLGMQVSWKEDSKGNEYLDVCQSKYTQKILKRFEMDQCNVKKTPAQAGIYMKPNSNPIEEVDKELHERFRAMVGALIYLMVLTRPDIAYAVGAVSQHMSNPNEEHETACLRIFRYLKGTQNYSLKYFKANHGFNHSDLKGDADVSFNHSKGLFGVVDSNFMGDFNCKSVTGYIFFSQNGIICWLSKRQTVVGTSTSHAETIAYFQAVQENTYQRRLVKDFNLIKALNGPTLVMGDNQACIDLIRKDDNMKHARTKHWEMQWSWLHQERENHKSFVPKHIAGKDNVADLFTKPVTQDILQKFVNELKLGSV